MLNAAPPKIGEMSRQTPRRKGLAAARGIVTGLSLSGPVWILAAMLAFSLTIRH